MPKKPIDPPPLPEDPNKGEKGDVGDTGPRGPKGEAAGTNLEVLNSLDRLGTQVDNLDTNVKDERKARLKEAESRDNQAKWYRRALAGMFIFVVISTVAAVESYNTAQDTDENARNDKKQAVKSDERIQASLVGVCAVVNVNRLSNQNMLAEINSEKPFELNAAWPEFLEKWRAEWAPIECRALVSDEIGVQLCLQYPPTIDPNTGKPVPTTIDPINEKACPELQPKRE